MALNNAKLKGVHPDLVKVITTAYETTPVDFKITQGLRTLEEQKKLVAAGASKTMNSRHLTGHAVDIACLVDGVVRWDWPLYTKAARHILKVAASLKIPVVWGGDWVSFKDGPHFELDRKKYPAKK